MNRVQQENAVGGDALQEQPRAGSPQVGTTSLLSLPDDLLLLVYEELYEDQYGDEIISPPFSEILVNRRIFNLVRPLWISRLSITESQLDQRLVGLLDNPARRAALRRLDLQFHESHAHLIRITLSRLTSLVELRIRISVTPTSSLKQIIFKAIQEGGSVTKLEFHIALGIESQVGSIWNDFKNEMRKLRCFKVGSALRRVQRGRKSDSGPWDISLLNVHFPPFKRRLASYQSLEYGMEPTPNADEFLQCFEETVAQDSSGAETSLSLRRLVLSIIFPSRNQHYDQGYFTGKNLARLFRILSLTQIERLEFNSLNWIPLISEQHPATSIKLLRLSGFCTFAGDDNFRNFSSLLRNLPSLTHLHLIGSNFFSDNLKADDISKINEFTTSFRYPSVGALLFVLRTTEVKVFTFRGAFEKREMRWTRISKNDEFDRDCWTLRASSRRSSRFRFQEVIGVAKEGKWSSSSGK